MERKTAIKKIEQKLGSRKLIYFGTRGADAVTLSDIKNFHSIFSQIAPLNAKTIEETSLELMKKKRVDLDTYSIDLDSDDTIEEFKNALDKTLATKSAVIPYRPTSLLSSAYFPNKEHVKYLGGFHELQSCFEYKPWVESSLRELGISVIPWEYYSISTISTFKEILKRNPFVIRKPRSDGGAGFLLIESSSDIDKIEREHFLDDFFAIAPFLSKSISLNINACVFQKGHISIHPLSLQIIGEKKCTSRDFGYCGNDFGKAKDILEKKQISELQNIINVTGKWLHSKGYIGVFGIDFLVYNNKVYLTEVNPRFQGSSAVSSMISKEMGLSDVFMDHILAFLNITSDSSMKLEDLMKNQLPYSHIISHNPINSDNNIDLSSINIDKLPFLCRLLPDKEIDINPEAICFQAVFRKTILDNHGKLYEKAKKDIEILYKVVKNSQPSLF